MENGTSLAGVIKLSRGIRFQYFYDDRCYVPIFLLLSKEILFLLKLLSTFLCPKILLRLLNPL